MVNQVKGSSISGDSVNIDSGKNLTIKGSNVVGTNDVTLHGDKDVTITSAQETGKDEHYKRVKKSGLFSGGGLGFTIGSQETKTTLNEQVKDEIGSTVGSIAGNVKITAGNNVKSEGTTMVSGKDLEIKGKDVTIDNTINTYDSQYKYEFKQTGLSVSVSGGVVDTALNAYNEIQRAGEVQDNRLAALYDYKAFKDLEKVKNVVKSGDLTKGVGINVSFGSTSTTIDQKTHIETVNTSNINAGGNVKVTSTEKDIDITGTKINATNITLDAKKDLNINAAQNKQETDTKTHSSSWSVGGTIGVGYSGNFSNSNGKENGNTIVNTGSVLNASDTMDIRSGNDTNITGSKVIGDKVVANITGDLNIESTQDSDYYSAKNKSVGIGISTERVDGKAPTKGAQGPINKVTSVGVNGTYNTSKTESTYESVTEQAGIYAGKKGFDITVGKTTDLRAAVISSKATYDKNKIDTGCLTWRDKKNKAEYDSSSSGVNLDKNGHITPNLGMPVSGEASSITQSAISPGTIIVNGVIVNPENLSRDTNSSLNALGKIFDKKTVQEKQELARVFGEEAFKAVGDIALREYTKASADAVKANKAGDIEAYNEAVKRKEAWGPGGTNEVLLHTVIGGLTSSLSGNSFASGAVSAGLSEASRNFLKDLPPELQLLGSAIIGSTAAKLVGVNGQVGASTATSGLVNNGLSHDDQIKLVNDLTYAINNHSKAGIVLSLVKWSAVDTKNNILSPGMGESGEKDTIDLLNAAAEELGVPFSYNENDSVHNNMNAFWGSLASSVPSVDLSTVTTVGVPVVVAGTALYLLDNGNWVKAGAVYPVSIAGQGALRFTQITASPFFSQEGTFAGKTIGEVANALRNGSLAASEVPVEFIVKDGNQLIVNTRSALALTRAGIPQSAWNLVNKTGDAITEAKIAARLAYNQLTTAGAEVLRITGLGKNASNLE